MPAYNMLKGTGVAIVTPFDRNGNIDFTALKKLVHHLIEGKVEYLVVLGTTGESVTLSKEEKQLVLQCVVETNNKKLPIILGVGGSNTAEVVAALKPAYLNGVDAILSVTPYYNKPNQQGLYEHYKTVTNSTGLPIILYNVPGRTSVNMLAETQLRLATDFKNIVATKEASGNFEQINTILQYKPDGFTVISGDDAITLPLIACGAEGVISVVANAFPFEMSQLVRFSLENRFDQARQLHFQLNEITRLMFAEGSPAGVKETLQYLGICSNQLRLPLTNVSASLSKKIQSEINALLKHNKTESINI